MSEPVRSLDRLTIPKPCEADWDSMIGNDQVRFCEHCNLHVTDLSALTRPAAMRLVAQSQGRLCVRVMQRPGGGVLTRTVPKQLYRISRRASRIAAGAFTATLSLASAAGQSRPSEAVIPEVTQMSPEAARNKTSAATARLWGTVLDPNDAVIPGATIKLTNTDSHIEQSTTSSDSGEYSFQTLSPGTYTLSVKMDGFRVLDVTDIQLEPNSSEQIDARLEVRAIALGGVVVFVAPEEPLVKAVFDEDLEAVKQLAFSYRNVDIRDQNTQMTALDQAAEKGNLEIVRTLVLAGARGKVRDEGGRTPLMYLRANATSDLVRELLSAGVKVNARDEAGETALMNAASLSNYAVVKELIENGAKIDLRDDDGKTGLMFAAGNEDPRIAKLLIDAGANVNAKDKSGKTALMTAAEEGDPETLKLLISFNASVNDRDENGWSALMYAAAYRDVESVEALLNAGADVTFKDVEGQTALALALKRDEEEVVKRLKSRGAPE